MQAGLLGIWPVMLGRRYGVRALTLEPHIELGVRVTTAHLIKALASHDAVYFEAVSSPEGLAGAMIGFGLTPDTEGLITVSGEEARAILESLLWKGMAYGEEHRTRDEASRLAEDFIEQYNAAGATYFSNGNWAKVKSWSPMTNCTFDSGIIVQEGAAQFSCIWFRDED